LDSSTPRELLKTGKAFRRSFFADEDAQREPVAAQCSSERERTAVPNAAAA